MVKDMLFMVRRDGSRVVYLLDECRLPEDPISELKRIDVKENFVRGFFLDKINDKEAIEIILIDWRFYNRSLQGIWESPRFDVIYRSARKSSDFIFYDESWISARYKYDMPDVIDWIDIEEMIEKESK